MTRFKISHRGFPSLIRSLAADIRAATAIEFGLLLPVYLLLIFGIIEVSLVLFFSLNMSTAATAGAEYLRKAAAGRTSVTDAEFRQVIASNFLLATTEKDLKISLIAIADADLATAPVVFPVENKFEAPSKSAGQYLLALGYDWKFILPTTHLLVPSSGGKPQLQNVSLAITAVRVSE
ncbi:TadE/TadG family type IV pilus assembly protein [Rhizobium nepotum]|uniref:Pilus assembly protein TadE n=1 Tax=Rhizobium nepotum 39/7 TaxID=1368418 RepID=A0ABR5CP40_9HYPH|nr:TadE/TadG family type IV pilus assembly protein [Rhizobium nepotum]KJF66615.1 pilus assembly protein TadE [Rhizobium nepotum 39/7]